MLEIKDVKPARVRLGLTQVQLAKAANLSQSVIAKLESGRIDPSYSTAQRIFAALETHRKKSVVKAKDIMHKSVISVTPNTTVEEAIKIMRKHAISQIPVCNPMPVGIITEATIIKHLNNIHCKVSAIMEPAPPTLASDADLAVISNLLMHYPLICITEKGECVGVITKADVLKAIV